VDANKSCTATFAQNEYTLTANTVGSVSVTKNPNQSTYHYGDVITLTAVPAANWLFSNWSGDLTGIVNPTPFTISGNNVVTATFLNTCEPVGGAGFNYSPTAPRVGQPVNFTATVITGTSPITFTWDFGHGANVITTTVAIAHSFPPTTTVQTYNVKLTAANACGSEATTPTPVKVSPYGIYLPLIRR
jgi:large repetitive protein